MYADQLICQLNERLDDFENFIKGILKDDTLDDDPQLKYIVLRMNSLRNAINGISDEDLKEGIDQIIGLFGFMPSNIGIRYRGYWLIEEGSIDAFDLLEVKEGWLVVEARDGGDNAFDESVTELPNYVGYELDADDATYVYYVFKPLLEVK